MASGGHRMPPNPHVVGRIEECRIDKRPVADNPLQKSGIAAVATSQPVITEYPDIAQLRSWCCRNRWDDLNAALIEREAVTLPLEHAFGFELADPAAIEMQR
jgi:hypothetical protein